MKQISTENLHLLPSPTELKQICKGISILEAILCQDWSYRYYSYQKNWGIKEEICEMKTGQGDKMLLLFTDKGVCINGFAHESKMNGWTTVVEKKKQSFLSQLFGSNKKTSISQKIPEGIFEGLPEIFHDFIFGEPVKSIGTTFCIWQTNQNEGWKTGTIKLPADAYKDGSSDLLQLLTNNPLVYKNWAEAYYEIDINEAPVMKIFNGALITKQLVHQLNPSLQDYEQLSTDLDEIGCKYEM